MGMLTKDILNKFHVSGFPVTVWLNDPCAAFIKESRMNIAHASKVDR